MAIKHITVVVTEDLQGKHPFSYCGAPMTLADVQHWSWAWDLDPETCERCARSQRSEAKAVVAAGRMGS